MTSLSNNPLKLLITGASGFVGRAMSVQAVKCGMQVRGTILAHETAQLINPGFEAVVVEPLGPSANWEHAVTDIDTVVHLAARVHVMKEHATDPLKEFRAINTEGTLQLAKQAAAAGVKRFVFMSTIGVNGDNSGDKPYMESDQPHPHNPYSVSKYEAELALQRISLETGMEVVIIRAPLVYGPGNPGNFLSLLRIVNKSSFKFWVLSFELKGGIPLPFASICNSRSLIYVGNLVDALATCATHPEAAGNTYLVSDGEDVTTPELLRRVAHSLEVPVRLLPFPVSLMKFVAKLLDSFEFWVLSFGLFGSKAEKPTQNSKLKTKNRFSGAVNRLTGSLTVDCSKIRRELGWVPPFTMEEGLGETGGWFRGKL